MKIMTAKEYLETRRCNSAVSKKCDMCYMDAAYIAIEMAKQEEREKAIEKVKMAYKNALYECKTNKGTYKSPIYIFEDLMKNCDKLLNQ